MIAGARDAAVETAPEWLVAALPGALSGVARLPWGFTNETWSATTRTGDRYAVTRMASAAAASFVVEAGPEIARRVGAVGLSMPVPIPTLSDPSHGVVVSGWLDGAPAMSRLRGAAGAAAIGGALGQTWRRLHDVDSSDLALDATWARPSALASAARGWLARLEPAPDRRSMTAISSSIQTVAALSAPSRVGFVHGDLVPANLLLREESNALLDLEAARIGDPLLDAAWFRWIVAYHHPELEAAAWNAFTAAAGLARDDQRTTALLEAYPVLRILEILAGGALPPAARARWIAQLDGALARAAKA